MTLVLRNDEKMEKTIDVNTVYGKGKMYVTTNTIVIEINKKGIVFERSHTEIASIEALDKKKIKITWPEGHQLFDFTFKTNDAQTHVKEIAENHKYDDNFPDLVGINTVILSEKDQKLIVEKRLELSKQNMAISKKLLDEANLKVNMIASNDPDKSEKILTETEKTSKLHNYFTMWEEYHKVIPQIIMNRSKKIPSEIPNQSCWNDCWYDKDSDCFVTLNDFLNVDWFNDFEEVKKFNSSNNVPNAHAIPYGFVWFVHGYPILSPEAAADLNVPRLYLPTLTDEMIKDEMISKKFGIDIETVGDALPVKIKPTINYKVSDGSKLILTNGDRYKLTRKETLFFLNRNMIPQEEKQFLP